RGRPAPSPRRPAGGSAGTPRPARGPSTTPPPPRSAPILAQVEGQLVNPAIELAGMGVEALRRVHDVALRRGEGGLELGGRGHRCPPTSDRAVGGSGRRFLAFGLERLLRRQVLDVDGRVAGEEGG